MIMVSLTRELDTPHMPSSVVLKGYNSVQQRHSLYRLLLSSEVSVETIQKLPSISFGLFDTVVRTPEDAEHGGDGSSDEHEDHPQ